jgi:hypothetical protein
MMVGGGAQEGAHYDGHGNTFNNNLLTSNNNNNNSAANAAKAELTDDEAPHRSLEQAQAYEHRDIVPPLMVKRRLKPKITLSKT